MRRRHQERKRYDWSIKPKIEEQKYIEQMTVFEVVDREEASGSKVIRTRWVGRHE